MEKIESIAIPESTSHLTKCCIKKFNECLKGKVQVNFHSINAVNYHQY